jgi:hypothetical protein
MDNYPDTFAFVQIHMGSDGYDTAWGNARRAFYTDVTGWPTTFFDSTVKHAGSHTYPIYQSEFLSRQTIPTDVTIAQTGDLVSGQTYSVQAEVCIEAGGTGKTMRIYMVQVLDYWPLTSDTPSGASYSRNGFKQAAYAYGTEPDITLAPGECQTIVEEFTFDARSWASQEDIKIIVWAQEPQSSSPPSDRAEVFQAAVMHWPFPPSGPANDDCDHAMVATNGVYSGSTEEATTSGLASCGDSDTSPDLWYSYRAGDDGTLVVHTCSSSYDTVLSVHSDCPGTVGNELGCNDDSDNCGVGSDKSYLSLPVTEGEVYMIRVAGHAGTNGVYLLNIDGPVDVTAPSPDPMSFSSPPAGSSASEIEMMATEATDVGSPPVEYEFDFVSGGSGGTSSAWQASREYTDSGLAPDTAYTYRVRARDGALNETDYSGDETAYTLAATPNKPTLSNYSVTRMDLDVNPTGNPGHTEFAIQCVTSPDPNWSGMYVDASGYPAGSAQEDAVWETDAEWGVITLRGMIADTNYCWRVKARNQDGIETDFCGWQCHKTTTEPTISGDLDDDGDVDLGDYAIFANCLAGPEVTTPPGDCSADEFNWADVHPDDNVDLWDFAKFQELFIEY